MPNLMTVGEVARELGVSADAVRWWERTGKLAASRTRTGVRLFRLRDVERLAAAREEAKRQKENHAA